jgi:photosystem II stability/assembly factor-like uncharacterized protein
MKKITLLLCLLWFALNLQSTLAQPWINYLPAEKNTEELTLKDYKQAFNAYLESFVDERELTDDIKRARENGLEKFRRWEYYMEGVVEPETGVFPNQTGVQVVKEHKKNKPEVYANTPKASNWSSMGPFSSGGGYAGIGRINCAAFHPSNPDIWWVGAASGGLWATTNNGSSWVTLTDDNGVLAVSDIVIPTNFATSQTIYIATGDRSAGDNNSIGVLKSTDNGATWNETDLTFAIGQGRRTNRLLLDPNDNNIIIAATNVGVYKTTDGGTTWNEQLFSQNFIDMEFKPGDFNTLYGSNGSGVWKTSDGGDNWEKVLSYSQQRTELAVSPANPNVVYALVSNNSSGLHGVYKSTNSGESFEQVAGSSPNMLGWGNGDDSSGQGWYDLCIAASPSNADIVLIGGINTWRSMNGGTSWNMVNHWYGGFGVQEVHADKHTLVYRNDGVLFEGNDGGIYISTQNGTSGTWVDKTNGMQISQMYKLGCATTTAGVVITGLQDNGTKVFTNNNWYDFIGGDGMDCQIDYTNSNIQYGSLYFGQFFRTTNGWNSYVDITPSDAGDGAWVSPIIIDPKNPQIIYAGYNDLWRSLNRGNSWTKMSTVNTNNKLKNIAICESDPNVIFMADDTRMWKTLDGGVNWSQVVISGTGSGTITSICIKNSDPNTIWFTRGGYNINGVFKTDDSGTSWTNISEGLPSIPMYSLVYNKLDILTEQLYVGSEVGVYYKEGDKDWVAFNNGFPNVKIGQLDMYYNMQNPEACRLRAATYGRGLWESPIQVPTEPVAGTVTGTSKLCKYESAQLFLIGFAGLIQWQESYDADKWDDIPWATSDFYQTDLLEQSTYYRAKVTLGITVYSNEFFVEVIPTPETPVISRIDNTLISNTDKGNQWFNQDGPIPGAIEKTFIPTENGTYFVMVIIDDCPSYPSNSIIINDLYIGGNAINDGGFIIFPNPTNEQLRIANNKIQFNRVILIDVLGKEVINVLNENVNETTINMKMLPDGIYLIKIVTNTGVFTSKVVKQ